MYEFYSEDEIKNAISKQEMNAVIVNPIHKNDDDVFIKVGDDEWESLDADTLASRITDKGRFGLIVDDGIFVFSTEDERIKWIETH